MARRLHIGGYYRQEGWEVLDANPGPHVDHQQDATDLSQFPDGCFTEIYASHVIEHFKYADVLPAALKEWCRVLAPGGRAYISVPDMDNLCRLFLTEGLNFQERFKLMRMLFGGQIDEHDVHMVGLNLEFSRLFSRPGGLRQHQEGRRFRHVQGFEFTTVSRRPDQRQRDRQESRSMIQRQRKNIMTNDTLSPSAKLRDSLDHSGNRH